MGTIVKQTLISNQIVKIDSVCFQDVGLRPSVASLPPKANNAGWWWAQVHRAKGQPRLAIRREGFMGIVTGEGDDAYLKLMLKNNCQRPSAKDHHDYLELNKLGLLLVAWWTVGYLSMGLLAKYVVRLFWGNLGEGLKKQAYFGLDIVRNQKTILWLSISINLKSKGG